MAAANRPPIARTPEEKIAQLFSAKHGLVPPVPIEDLIRDYADIESDVFPGTWDALLLRQPRVVRPKIILSRVVTNQNRRRFTLAHELGHIIIPWSLGTVFCHANITYQAHSDLLQAIEAEANRFARELLVPRDWITRQFEQAKEQLAPFLLEMAQEAQVSPIVAMLASASIQPPGTLLLVADRSNDITYHARSPGTYAKAPLKWEAAMEADLIGLGARVGRVQFGDNALIAIEFLESEPTTAAPVTQTSAQLLEKILEDVFETDLAHKAQWRVNGIIGAANSALGSQANETAVHRALQQAFASKADLRSVTTHIEFANFLRKKAAELAARRGTERR